MERIDRMGITRTDDITDDVRYGSLYRVIKRPSRVNDYGGADAEDAALLDNISDCLPGSTCLFSNGDIYRLELSGWVKFGESTETEPLTSLDLLNLSPTTDRVDLSDQIGEIGKESDVEAVDEDVK